MDTQKFAEILYGTVLPSGIDLTEQAKIVAPLFTYSSSIVPSSLFRYRRCNERNIDAFYKNQCWVSLAKNMNDGFDGRLYYDQKALLAWRDKLTSASNSMDLKDFFLSGNGFPQSAIENFPGIYQLYLLISSAPELQVCDMINDYRRFIIEDIDSINTILATSIQNTIKFCCLSEKIDSSAMWGLYANNETGFALEYNFSSKPEAVQLQERSNMYTCFPVIYSDNRYKVLTEYIQFLLIRRWLATAMQKSGYIYKYPAEANLVQSAIPCPDIFVATKVALHKSREWEHEGEWRVFAPLLMIQIL